ncbi:MAG: ABC transporter permease, partial [Phycisphaerae bacterium]|nr:ABC transporter permease [Phycisphaerae bacterium]
GGQELELLGAYVPADLKKIRAMTGESLMPITYSALGEEQRGMLASLDTDQMNAEVASGVGLESDQQLPPLSPSDVIILPAKFAARMGASLRGICMATATLEDAKKAANEMADRVAFPIYYGSPDEVHVLAATALTPQAPKSLSIMLVIAGLIIFNTMLNSIAERKKEIYIYSSLGLAPMHIGVLFLAEAATYGLMGSIFGYVVGQGVATGLTHFFPSVLGGVTLNYSGTQAIATMMLVVGVTLLSALVPAYMAGKLAAPSDTMKWKVPAPDNDVIRDTLPFTVTAQTANGIAMFLHDYLDAHREGSIGHFSTDNQSLRRTQAEGRDVLAIEATVWLTPYDLGVRQDVLLTITSTGEAGVLQVDVELRRGAGQVRSWWKLNRVFLGDLRRQLLGWRKLKAERVLEYIAAGEAALAGL